MLQLCSKAGMKTTSNPQNNSNMHNNRDWDVNSLYDLYNVSYCFAKTFANCSETGCFGGLLDFFKTKTKQNKKQLQQR